MTEALLQEIRTLKSVFESARDPEGRAFAPLADAYRRSGEIQQAVRLLNEGLARHPNFVPGHVVAARLYAEQGLSQEAQIAARNALELDAENVSALRSLLRVLEEGGDAEAEEVRARLLALEPDFVPEEPAPPPPPRRPRAAAPPPPPDVESEPADEGAAQWSDAAATSEDVDGEAATVEMPSLRAEEAPPALEATRAMEAIDLESMSIDIESLSSGIGGAYVLDPVDETPVEDIMPTLVAGFGTAGDEPVIDLEDLSAVSDDVSEVEEEAAPLAEIAAEPEPVEEPVLDLEDLAPVVEAPDEEEVVGLADLAPEAELELPSDEPVIDLEDLAPLAPQVEEEPVMDLAELAPAVEEEPVMDLAELAPAVEEEPVMDLAELAPAVEEEPVMDLAELAPAVEEEPVMDLAELAPAVEEEPVMDLAELAPQVEEEPVMDLAELAPAVDEEPVMDLGELAPEVDEEPVMDLGELAPSEPDEQAETEPVTPEPAELTMLDLAELTAEEVVIDMDELVPPRASESVDDEDEAAPAVEDDEEAPAAADSESDGDEEGVGEPVYTRTLAELYVKQGAFDEALEVYRHLSELSPGDEQIARRIEELESGMLPEEAAHPEETESLARDLTSGDDGHHDVETPFAWSEQEAPRQEESGASIKDYFDGLLNWKSGGHS